MRVVTLLALLGVASATVLESLHDIPDGWKQIGLPAQQRSMHVRIAMKSVEPDRFEQKLYDTSNPSSPNYAQYLKRDELREMMRPSPKATAAVLDWLIRSGVNASSIADEGMSAMLDTVSMLTLTGEWIHIVAPVEVLDDMLDTSFGLFRNDQGQFRVRTLQYSVPDDLEQYGPKYSWRVADVLAYLFQQIRPHDPTDHPLRRVPRATQPSIHPRHRTAGNSAEIRSQSGFQECRKFLQRENSNARLPSRAVQHPRRS